MQFSGRVDPPIHHRCGLHELHSSGLQGARNFDLRPKPWSIILIVCMGQCRMWKHACERWHLASVVCLEVKLRLRWVVSGHAWEAVTPQCGSDAS